jgi:glycosyltransferase involved in cell wall biosynthesis
MYCRATGAFFMSLLARERRVAIVVCTHNKPEALNRALQVIAAQTYRSYAVVVTDDCSKQMYKNKSICDRFEGELLYNRNHECMGVWRNRNHGVNLAIQYLFPDLITTLDDDDYWPRDRLMIGMSAMAPNVGMSFGIQVMSNRNLAPLYKFPCNVTYRRALLHALFFGEFFFPAKTYLFNVDFLRELQLEPGQWYWPCDVREDIELGIRALRHAQRNPSWKVAYINRVLAHWIQSDNLSKFKTREYREKQMSAYADYAREYLPRPFHRLAVATAPYTFCLPHWLRYGLF